MKRTLFQSEHDDFRASFRTFLQREVVPYLDGWDRDGIVPKEAFLAAGEGGFLAMAVPEQYGGAGADDFRFNVVVGEEIQYAGAMGFGMTLGLHNDICLPYFLELTTDEQKERWLPGIVTGELLTAVAMTEPGTGSDLAGIATRARREDDGYRLDGAKTFITSGVNASLFITAARTGEDRHGGLSLLVVEDGTEGFARGRNLEKLGLHAQDTAELFFDDAFVPQGNLLGAEGDGFRSLVRNLAQERLGIAVGAVAAAEAALDWTIAYVRERTAFGRPIGALQATRFTLAEARTEVDLGRVYVDRCVEALDEGALSPEDAAKAKWWCTEMQGRVIDRCVQLHGGYGYMLEYPITRAYADARISRIYGGTTEVMKDLIGRQLQLA